MNLRSLFGIAGAIALASTSTTLAQGTEFTYQGELNDNGSPADGLFDIEFSVWNAAAGPAQVGGTLAINAVEVTDGLFTVTLDFGAGVFTGPDRWLEIGVRTNGGGGFTTLAPRTKITASPYSIYSGTASTVPNSSIGSAQIANGSVTASDLGPNSVGTSEVIDNSLTANDLGANSVGASEIATSAVGTSEIANGSVTALDLANDNGSLSKVTAGTMTDTGSRIGIGTSTPGAGLEVAGAGIWDSSIGIRDTTSGQDWRMSVDDTDFQVTKVEGTTFTPFKITAIGTSDTLVIDNSKVGIGTAAPSDTLHVFNSGNDGDITIENTYPFLNFNKTASGNNAGIRFLDGASTEGWISARGSDDAIVLASTTSGTAPNQFVLQRDQNVGIGTASAFTELTVNGTIGFPNSTEPAMYIHQSGTINPDKPVIVHSPGSFADYGMWYEDDEDTFTFRSTATDAGAIRIAAHGGWMTINTATRAANYELSVNGQIACEELLVLDSGSWPDYVFAEDYDLMPLKEVEAHIKANKRLPGIPAAEIVAEEGISVGAMQKRMMEKIEELTLYTLEQERRIAELESRLARP